METGLSDFHKMTVAVMKTTFQKLKPKITTEITICFPMIDLEKNFRLNYQWKQ